MSVGEHLPTIETEPGRLKGHRAFAGKGWGAAVAVMLAALFVLVPVAPAIAQQYPPPVPTRTPQRPGPTKSPKPEKTPKAAVLGTTVSNDGGSSLGTTVSKDGGSGVLPRTGGQILVWLLWAAVFLALGSALVAGSSYRERFASVRSLGHRRGRLADEGAEIPRIDTSHFVPFLSKPERKPGVDRRRTPRTGPAPRKRKKKEAGT